MLAGLALMGGQAGAAPTPPPGSPRGGNAAQHGAGIVSKTDLQVWRAEGDGNGRLGRYKPARRPGYYGIGTVPSAAQIAGWTIAVPPGGADLPSGSGTAAAGAAVYASDCAMCHGAFGEGAHDYPALAGGVGSLGGSSPERTVGSYWPYATTVWDYINRAMPFYAPHTLKPDQVYALTAYILNMNGVTRSDWVADAASVPLVRMPNRDGFDWSDPRPVTHNTACMEACVRPSSIRITSSAVTMHLTPRMTGPVDHMKSGQ